MMPSPFASIPALPAENVIVMSRWVQMKSSVLSAVGRVRASCVAAPRIGVDTRAVVVGLLEQLTEIARECRSGSTRWVPVERFAEGRDVRPVLDRLKHQVRSGCSPASLAAGPARPEHRGGRVRAVAAVDIHGSIIDDAVEAAAGAPGQLKIALTRAAGMSMKPFGGTVAQSGVGNSDRLRRTVEAIRVGGRGPMIPPPPYSLFFFRSTNASMSRDVKHVRDGIQLSGRGGDLDDVSARGDESAPRRPQSRRPRAVDVRAALDSHPISARGSSRPEQGRDPACTRGGRRPTQATESAPRRAPPLRASYGL